MKSQKQILEEIVRKLQSGKRIIFTGIDSDFDFRLFSEIETIVKSALEVVSKEVIGIANRTAGYFKKEYTPNYAESANSY